MRFRWWEAHPVSVRVVLEGPAEDVLRALRKMGRPKFRFEAHVSARIIKSDNRRKYERYDFPPLERGAGGAAVGHLDELSRRCLIEPEVEKTLDDVFSELMDLTSESAGAADD